MINNTAKEHLGAGLNVNAMFCFFFNELRFFLVT